MISEHKILIVDDSAAMRQELKKILTDAGYNHLLEAGDGHDAIEKYNDSQPDIMILDLLMPFKGALDIINEIDKEAKVVVIGMPDQKNIVAAAQAAGAKGVIYKPFDKKAVIAAVEQCLGK